MTARLFKRQVLVQIGNLTIRDFRVDFNVFKSLKAKPPNSANITIYNIDVTDPLIRKLQTKAGRDIPIRLLAGFDVPHVLFDGRLIKNGADVEDDIPEVKLKLKLQDRSFLYRNARINKTFNAGMKFSEVLAELGIALGVPPGTVRVIEDFEFPTSVTLNGRVADLLDDYAATGGADWSLQDGKLQFLPKGQTRRNTGPLYSHDNLRLMGRLLPKGNGVVFNALLDAALSPGDYLAVKDVESDLSGAYKAHTITYRGSTHGDEFKMTVEARDYVTEEEERARVKRAQADVDAAIGAVGDALVFGADKLRQLWSQ